MKNDTKNTASDNTKNNKNTIIGIVLIGVAIAALVAVYAYSSTSKIVYQPTNACDLLTADEAEKLMGTQVISSYKKEDPVVSENTAVSKCGYTDRNMDVNSMVVAAVTVRSGINDEGVKQNKTEFFENKPEKSAEEVKNLGQSAYYNTQLGQLNILDGKKWIILSYGVGSTPEANTQDNAIKLAKEVL